MSTTHSSTIKVISSLQDLAKDLVGLGQETLVGAADLIEVFLKENSELKVCNADLVRQLTEERADWEKSELKFKEKIRELEAKILPPNNPSMRSAPPPKSKYFPEPKP